MEACLVETRNYIQFRNETNDLGVWWNSRNVRKDSTNGHYGINDIIGQKSQTVL